jgi:hypothetical protein
MLLMAAGMRRVEGDYAFSLRVWLFTCNADLDKRLPVIVDVVRDVLEIDDRWLQSIQAQKSWARHRDEQCAVIEVTLHRLLGEPKDAMTLLNGGTTYKAYKCGGYGELTQREKRYEGKPERETA